jgi:purine-nucleoside phosphorylase
MTEYEKLQTALAAVREKTDFVPKVALVLGSGLGDYGDTIDVREVVDYHDIPGFPVSTVFGHRGRFIFGYVDTVPVVIMQGRVHFYEGYSMNEVVMPIRLMKLMGAEILMLTNAVGGISPRLQSGGFMLIRDQISFFVPSPLIGQNIDELGPRFPDMSEIYDKALREEIKAAAQELNIDLPEGVYLQLRGPNYESPAEIKAAATLGADVVGMSTACEAIAANHMGMKICGISCISNLAAGISQAPLSHKDVQETAELAAPRFKALITSSIIRLGKL